MNTIQEVKNATEPSIQAGFFVLEKGIVFSSCLCAYVAMCFLIAGSCQHIALLTFTALKMLFASKFTFFEKNVQ